MKPLQISEPAALELAEAVRWHEARRSGSGGRLFDAIARTLAIIESYPESGAPRHGVPNARQLNVRGFPYSVAYRIRPQDVYVVAIAHAKRRPGYWQRRS